MSFIDAIELRWLLEHPNQPDSKRLQYRDGFLGPWRDVPTVIIEREIVPTNEMGAAGNPDATSNSPQSGRTPP